MLVPQIATDSLRILLCADEQTRQKKARTEGRVTLEESDAARLQGQKKDKKS